MIPPKQIRNLPVCGIDGTDNADQITGTNDVNTVDDIRGEGGNDTLNGRDGFNTLFGGCGEDTIVGGSSTDIVFAKDALTQDDVGTRKTIDDEIKVSGTAEQDTITCGLGDDTAYVDENVDIVDDAIVTSAPTSTSTCEKVLPNEPDIPAIHWARRMLGR